jgi:3,4-dihydroxy 2-butanone 4-phosphate synthase/GTP cyclohydrolase II
VYLRAKRDKLGHTLHHQGLAFDEELLMEEERRDSEQADSAPEGREDGGRG